MTEPKYILIDRPHSEAEWQFRGAFWRLCDALCIAARLRMLDADPVQYEVIWYDDGGAVGEALA